MKRRLGDAVKKFKITYLDYIEGVRKTHMGIAFDSENAADDEVLRLRKHEKNLRDRGENPRKGYFKVKATMVRPLLWPLSDG